MRRRLVILTSLLALAACNKPKDSAAAHDAAPAAPAEAKAAGAPADKPAALAVSAPMLAYSYEDTVIVPASALPDLMARHQKACVDAGPTVCQVVGASTTRAGAGQAEGMLKVRAAPGWLAGLRERLPSDARAAGGQLADSNVVTEDLSRQIVDTEAAIRARTALRDRLQQILATRPGKLSDLLEVEMELARVQGELDATQSELAVMRTRVATSLLSISYQSKPPLMAPQGSWAPLALAVRGASGVLASTLGLMVTILVAFLPWAAVAGGALWIWRLLDKARRARAKAPPPKAP
jgi:hypothetical protein